MKIFKSQDKMTIKQQEIATEFEQMIESEYALCVSQIKKANSVTNNPNSELANAEIDAINKYWQQRLGNLIELIEIKNYQLNKNLAMKYLKN